MRRRPFLAAGTAAMASLAGCSGGGQSIERHPAGTALSAQPTLGPDPGTSQGTIVGFEDPSCHSCARFEQEVFPRIRRDLVDPGTVSFVYRPIPVIYEWAGPAVFAMESVQSRDEGSFWGLKEFYYRNQRSISASNVREATRQYVARETDLDADGVLDDVANEAHRAEVETNLDAADEAGVSGTPTFHLFEDGSFQTKLVGPQDYSVFASALGV